MKSIKIFIDGVVEGKMVVFFENYVGELYNGFVYLDQEVYNEMVVVFDKVGIQVYVYVCGDKGVNMILNVFEYVR